MATTILDAVQQATSLPANIAVSAGTSRKLFIAIQHGSAVNAGTTGEPEVGGQISSVVGRADDSVGEHDVTTSVFEFTESQISAMVGTDAVLDGVNISHVFWWSVQGADQAVPAFAAAATIGTSGAITLARAKDSVTFVVAAHDYGDTFTASANPPFTLTNDGTGAAYSFAFGQQAEAAAGTSDFTWSANTSRPNATLVLNVAPTQLVPKITETLVADAQDTALSTVTVDCSIHDATTRALIAGPSEITITGGAFDFEDAALTYSTEYLIVPISTDRAAGRPFFASTQADPN